MATSETIILNPISVILPKQTFATIKNLASLQLSFQPTGGSFSMSLLRGSAGVPKKNTVLTMPFGRVGVVKNVGASFSSGGLLNTISGPIQPLNATQQTYLGFLNGIFPLASVIAQRLLGNVFWNTLDVHVRTYIYRGIALGGLQQISSLLLADIIQRADGLYVTDPGVPFSTKFNVQKSDIVAVPQQAIDYTLDIPSILNPALFQIGTNLGTFLYDSEHAQKGGKTTVQAGSPGADGSTDFIPIPDGWLVDGDFEEWVPTSSTDLTNPNASVGRYWKVFPSPTSPGSMRGITSFRRIIREIVLPNNVSSFVASPITSVTRRGVDTEFDFETDSAEGALQGFTAARVEFFDIISNQFIILKNAISLVPTGSPVSGDASLNFYSITMETWTFPSVGNIHFPNPTFDPTNPFNIPANVQVVNPSTNVVFFSVADLLQYWNRYLQNFQAINSPRLKTTVSVVYRNYLPQVGDHLLLPSNAGIQIEDCGRISSVTLTFGRAGMVINISAERYNYQGQEV
jgi:hypothetical protein